MITSTQVIDPLALDATTQRALVDELFALNQTIFHDVDRPTFERYLIGADAARCRIQVVRHGPDAVGYTAVQVFACARDGRPCLVIRSLAGMLASHRRQTLFGAFMAYEALRLRARHPTTPIYGFACPVHPSTYRMLARYAVDVWPHPERATPPEIARLMARLAERFGLQPETDHPGVCHVGWQTIQDADERRDWAASANVASRFFVTANPRYEEGYGLLTLVPLREARVVQGLGKLLTKRLRRALRRRWTVAVEGAP